MFHAGGGLAVPPDSRLMPLIVFLARRYKFTYTIKGCEVPRSLPLYVLSIRLFMADILTFISVFHKRYVCKCLKLKHPVGLYIKYTSKTGNAKIRECKI